MALYRRCCDRRCRGGLGRRVPGRCRHPAQQRTLEVTGGVHLVQPPQEGDPAGARNVGIRSDPGGRGALPEDGRCLVLREQIVGLERVQRIDPGNLTAARGRRCGVLRQQQIAAVRGDVGQPEQPRLLRPASSASTR